MSGEVKTGARSRVKTAVSKDFMSASILLRKQLPDTLTRAVRYHHDPSLSGENVLAYIVHVSDAIALMSGIGAGLDGMLYRIDDDALRFLGLRDEDIHEIMIEMVEAVQKLTDEMHDM